MIKFTPTRWLGSDSKWNFPRSFINVNSIGEINEKANEKNKKFQLCEDKTT